MLFTHAPDATQETANAKMCRWTKQSWSLTPRSGERAAPVTRSLCRCLSQAEGTLALMRTRIISPNLCSSGAALSGRAFAEHPWAESGQTPARAVLASPLRVRGGAAPKSAGKAGAAGRRRRASPGHPGRRNPAARRTRPATPPCPRQAWPAAAEWAGGASAGRGGSRASSLTPAFFISCWLGSCLRRCGKLQAVARQQVRFSQWESL